MKKKLLLGAALGLALLANTAFAISADYLSSELEANPRYPYETYCNAADVNVRSEANTDCDVVTMLQNGDKFYVRKVFYVAGSEYVWLYGSTERGQRGYMASQYLSAEPEAESTAGRFKAALESEFIWNPADYAAYSGYKMGAVEPAPEIKRSFDVRKVRVGPREFLLYEAADKTFEVVINRIPGDIAGYAVGQYFDVSDYKTLNSRFSMLGWNEAPVDAADDEPGQKIYGWQKSKRDADGFDRLENGFYVTVNNKRIIEKISYAVYNQSVFN